MSPEKKVHPCATGETCETAVLAGTSVQFHFCMGAARTTDASTYSTPTDRGSPRDPEDATADGGAD